MTAFAIDFQPKRLTVASDTLGYAPHQREAKPLGFVTKVFPIPHLKSVMFGRGMLAIPVQAAVQLMLSPTLFTIEDAAAALSGILDKISVAYAKTEGIRDYTSVALLELILAGWNAAEGRMRIFQFLSYDRYAVQADEGRYGLTPFPLLPAHYMPRLQGPVTDAHLVEVIEAVGRYFIDEPEIACGARVGGEVMAIELTPEGMAQRTLHRFADYEETRNAAAAVCARIERGDLKVLVADELVQMDRVIDTATGKPLRPAAANDRPLNRQQRRQLERLERRRA